MNTQQGGNANFWPILIQLRIDFPVIIVTFVIVIIILIDLQRKNHSIRAKHVTYTNDKFVTNSGKFNHSTLNLKRLSWADYVRILKVYMNY